MESLNKHLTGLLNEAELRLQELSLGSCSNETPSAPRASFSSIMSSAYPSSAMTGCAGGGDNDKQIAVWGRRARSLQRLVLGLNQSRPPDPPQSVNLDITGTASVSITLREPVSQESPIITKYKVQWSTKSDFGCLCGEREILDLQRTTCLITDLNPGLKYYFRASCGNLKGFGNYRLSTPTSVIPSSWRDVENKDSRFSGQLKLLDELFTKVRQARPCDATELPSLSPAAGNVRRNQKKKTTIKQLFTAASKFQKHLRRGVFLACILYHEDKVLVTNEDFLPVVEVDETYPSCINTDFHWLMKVACTWDDVKSLRTDMEKNSTSAIHFRTKLLAAASQMQSALCIQDLGQVFHKPLKDSSGTVVISTVNYIKTPKSVSILNSRWLPLNKVHKKLNVLSEEHNVGEILMGSIQEQITYHQLSGVRLGKGLYLGYLKMQSSVELIQVVVPAKTPNVLPHCKVRDNPHVSAEEWQYLKTYSQLQFDSSTLSIELSCSEQQRAFIDQIRAALKRLFQYMDLGPEDILTHRIYDLEVIELASDVSFVIVCPSAEMSCCVPGQREILLQRGDLLSLPVQAFEMIHLNTYQSNIIQRYSRISCVLELDTIVANHVLREAFSSSELSAAKEQLAKLSDLQTGLNSVWKTVRWLMDVIAFARDRSSEQGIVMKQLLDLNDADCCDSGGQTTNGLKRTLLQIPPRDSKIVKSSPSRGSWPGPGVSNNGGINGTLSSEFSKSEQHLSIVPHDSSSLNLSSNYLSATSDNESTRKSSLESYRSKESVRYLSDEMSTSRLPPSRSENTLVLSHRPLQQKQRSRSSIVVTSMSATTSPILNARPTYSGSLLSVNTVNTTTTSESVHSLSSDSDGTSCPIPIGSSTPSKLKKSTSKSVGSKSSRKSNFVEPKIKIDCTALHPDMNFLSSNYTNLESTTSKSLTNIRSDLNEARANFLKPTYLKSTLQDTIKRTDIMSSSQDGQQLFKTPYSVQKGDACAGTSLPDPMSEPSSPQPGILQVYAAYETGLASGTSLKLRVSPRTTAREVVDLVVKQLNMAVVLKGKEGPIYAPEKLQNFCLVAVIGARERCLRDDFKPLQLQNPWKKGRLYVRQKQDVLAAIEHSSKHSTVL